MKNKWKTRRNKITDIKQQEKNWLKSWENTTDKRQKNPQNIKQKKNQ